MRHRSSCRPSLHTANLTSVAVRALSAATFALALCLVLPAQAQAYDPRYPVCLHTYGIEGGSIECLYSSLAQCQATASGRAAQCLENPYFARMPAQPPGRAVRKRRVQS